MAPLSREEHEVFVVAQSFSRSAVQTFFTETPTRVFPSSLSGSTAPPGTPTVSVVPPPHTRHETYIFLDCDDRYRLEIRAGRQPTIVVAHPNRL